MLKMFIPFVCFLFSYTLRSSKHDLSSSSVIVDEINCPNKSCVLIIPQGKTVTETETENRNINNLINLCFFPSYAFHLFTFQIHNPPQLIPSDSFDAVE